jgi:hypothetical protein
MSRIMENRRAAVLAGFLAVVVAIFLLPRLELSFAVIPLVVLLLIGYLYRPASARDVDDFAARSGLTASPTSRRFIAHHLTTGRRLRVVLVTAALVLPNLVAGTIGVSPEGAPVSWSGVLWAYMAGTLWAELSVTRPTGTARVASLVPRDPPAYLGRALRWGPPAAGALAAVVWTGVAWLPAGIADSGVRRVDGRGIVAAVVFALLVPLLTIGAQHWILRRPQPLVDPELVAADDAVRAASVRNLAAVGGAVVLLSLAGGLLQYVEIVHVAPVDWVFGAGAAMSLGLALMSWWSRAWWHPVRRQPFALARAGW